MNHVISIHSFLELVLQNKESSILKKPVTLFIAREYPLLFFSSLLRFLSKNSNHYITIIDMKASSRSDVQRQLEGSFLGLETIFWLGSLSDLSANDQHWWLHYLSSYKGPHTIVAHIDQSDNQKRLDMIYYIDIPQVISFDVIMLIASIVAPSVDHERIRYFFKKVIEITGNLSIDQVCSLFSYCIVAGKNNIQFFQELLPTIVQPHHSLFVLSDAFFEKNSKKFMMLWAQLSSQFSIQFWIAFWSEQLWRAYFYQLCMKAGRIADAKKISYRLPYSFVQKHWKRHSLDHLYKGHTYLYDLDYACKNGAVGQEAILDLFCFEFMNN